MHTSLGAGAEIECDSHRLWIAEGRTAVLAPEERIRLRWSPGNQQMIARVPHTLVHEAVGCEEKFLHRRPLQGCRNSISQQS
ncbi:hypothetical protein AB4Z48_29955 [Cupriavidus sp. 2TAF22]|uniref:AraC-like ligand-binding domain-containing protein n=1 Tax=unclassified Cupriavidus TaxID=2640874 RepID=UPI003F92416D